MRAFSLCHVICALVLGVLALLGPEAEPALSQPAQCGRQANGASGAATTAIVVGAPGQYVHLCGWDVTATTAATFQLIQGTGATCGTNTVNITAAHAMSATNSLAVYGQPGIVSAIPGNGICVVITGTGPVQWTVFYAVFF